MPELPFQSYYIEAVDVTRDRPVVAPTVSVFDAGTSNLAALFQDDQGLKSLTNPITDNPVRFFVNASSVDVRFVSGAFTWRVDGVQPTDHRHVFVMLPSQGIFSFDHGGLSGLGDDDHVQYVLLTGRASTPDIGASGLRYGTVFGSDLDINGQLLVSGAGPHAIGGAAANQDQLILRGTFTPSGATDHPTALEIFTTVNGATNFSAFGLRLRPTLVETGAGTHPDFASAIFEPPTITPGAAALINASTVKITGAPTGATNNYALWVATGRVVIGSAINPTRALHLNLADQDGIRIQSAGTVRLDLAGGGGGGAIIDEINTAGLFIQQGGIEKMRLVLGILALGTTVTTGAAAGDLVLANTKALRFVNAAGTSALGLLSLNASDQLQIGAGAGTVSIQFGTSAPRVDGLTTNLRVLNNAGTTERLRVTDSGILVVGTSVLTSASGGDIGIIGAYRVLNNAGTALHPLIRRITGTDNIIVGNDVAGTIQEFRVGSTTPKAQINNGAFLLGTTSVGNAAGGDLVVARHGAFGADSGIDEGTDDSIIRIEELTSTQTSKHSLGLTVSHAWVPGSNPSSRFSVGVDILEIGAPTGGTVIPESIGLSVTMQKAGGSASGTITKASGLIIRTPTIAGATVTWTNNYGLDIEDQEVAAIATTERAVRLANANHIWWRNNANSADVAVLGLSSGDLVLLSPSGNDILWGRALVALGGGATPTFGTIGGSGPTTAAQNTWMRVVDTGGNPFWVPAWK